MRIGFEGFQLTSDKGEYYLMDYNELKSLPTLGSKLKRELLDSKLLIECSNPRQMVKLIEARQNNLSQYDKSKMIETCEGYRYPSFNDLKQEYEKICLIQNAKYKLEHLKTGAEFKFLSKIQAVTKLKVYTSVWIGARNVDLFLPSVTNEDRSGSRFFGIAFEVDGKIHNNHLKMLKDQVKYHFLDSLNIVVVSILNENLNHPLVNKMIEELKGFRRLDTRAKRRVWRKIYTETILCHGTNEQIAKLWGKIFKDS